VKSNPKCIRASLLSTCKLDSPLPTAQVHTLELW